MALSTTSQYRKQGRVRLAVLLASLILLAVLFLGDLLTGAAGIAVSDIVRFFTGNGEATNDVIIGTYRLPIAVMAVAVGSALGLSGALMQTILNNPLASPYTLGISAGAGFGAALAIVTTSSFLHSLGTALTPVLAFVFAFLTCGLIYLFGRGRGMAAETMILAGIGLSFLFGALQSLLQYIATPDQNANIVFWLFGSLTRANMRSAVLMLILTIAALPLVISQSWRLTALKMGNEKARVLGVNVVALRRSVFFLVSLLTATAVSFVGTIGFIGLAAPHISRLLIGEDQRFFLPISASFGANILLAASIISKVIIPGFIFPIGIVTAIIGVPFFFWLILTNKKAYFS
ncbi:MAG: iron ABC transporter permease [Flaviflexus sp.]|nr:iron ABC transporter permease [Flaviflexus sp.]